MAMKAAVAQLRPLIDVIDEFDRKQAELFAQHPDHEIFESLPGAGPVFAPRLMTVMGADRGRFEEAIQLAACVRRLGRTSPASTSMSSSAV